MFLFTVYLTVQLLHPLHNPQKTSCCPLLPASLQQFLFLVQFQLSVFIDILHRIQPPTSSLFNPIHYPSSSTSSLSDATSSLFVSTSLLFGANSYISDATSCLPDATSYLSDATSCLFGSSSCLSDLISSSSNPSP